MRVQGDRIRRLRAIGAVDDVLALRFRLERTLRSADLRPPGLPAHAIVCIRRLRLPMPPAQPEAWTKRFDREVQQLVPRGVRPFREAVPADAMVIVFADEAELLACLACDWHRRSAGGWWWQSLFGQSAGEELVQRAFASAVQAVPAAIALLAQVRLAVEIVSVMSPADCETLAAAVATTFAVRDWNQTRPPEVGPISGAQPEASHAVPALERAARLNDAMGGECANLAALAPGQRALLGLALLLHRDPALARMPGIARLLRDPQWPAPRRQAVEHDPAEATISAAAPVIAPSAAAGREPAMVSGPRHHVERGHPIADQPVRRAPPASESTRDDDCEIGRVPDETPIPIAAAASIDNEYPSSIDRPHDEIVAPPPPFLEVESECAGVVYLMNLALHLELYGDFTQPTRPGLDLPLGDFLALVGERAFPALPNDAMWLVLAQLAGRAPDEPPGRDFVVPESGTLDAWLDRLVAMLGARAAAGLGVPEEMALAFLCARAGRVVLSPTRLDAHFPLDAHPLAIRIAGLDRDPGWVPAAGRVIAYHYE